MLMFEKLNNKRWLTNFKPLNKSYRHNQQNKEDKSDKANKSQMERLLRHKILNTKKNAWKNQWDLNNI